MQTLLTMVFFLGIEKLTLPINPRWISSKGPRAPSPITPRITNGPSPCASGSPCGLLSDCFTSFSLTSFCLKHCGVYSQPLHTTFLEYKHILPPSSRMGIHIHPTRKTPKQELLMKITTYEQ